MSKKLHDPMLEEAFELQKRGEAVVEELVRSNQSFKDAWETQMNENKQEVEKLEGERPSKCWWMLPIIGWGYYASGNSDVNKQIDVINKKEQQERVSHETLVSTIAVTLKYCNKSLLPALRAYLKGMSTLQSIFTEFYKHCLGFKKNMDKASGALQEDDERRLKMYFKIIKKRGRELSKSCSSTVHLYNVLGAQFEALKRFSKVELDYRGKIVDNLSQIVLSHSIKA